MSDHVSAPASTASKFKMLNQRFCAPHEARRAIHTSREVSTEIHRNDEECEDSESTTESNQQSADAHWAGIDNLRTEYAADKSKADEVGSKSCSCSCAKQVAQSTVEINTLRKKLHEKEQSDLEERKSNAEIQKNMSSRLAAAEFLLQKPAPWRPNAPHFQSSLSNNPLQESIFGQSTTVIQPTDDLGPRMSSWRVKIHEELLAQASAEAAIKVEECVARITKSMDDKFTQFKEEIHREVGEMCNQRILQSTQSPAGQSPHEHQQSLSSRRAELQFKIVDLQIKQLRHQFGLPQSPPTQQQSTPQQSLPAQGVQFTQAVNSAASSQQLVRIGHVDNQGDQPLPKVRVRRTFRPLEFNPVCPRPA